MAKFQPIRQNLVYQMSPNFGKKFQIPAPARLWPVLPESGLPDSGGSCRIPVMVIGI
jgi:hypothetical protein